MNSNKLRIGIEKVNEVRYLKISFTYKGLGVRILINSKGVDVEIEQVEVLVI